MGNDTSVRGSGAPFDVASPAFPSPTTTKVRPRETTQQGERHSPRGKKIKIGGHVETQYGLDAVMNGWRGSETHEQHGDLQIGSITMRPSVGTDTSPKRKTLNTPLKDSLGG